MVIPAEPRSRRKVKSARCRRRRNRRHIDCPLGRAPAVGKAADGLGINLGLSKLSVSGDLETVDAIGIAFDHKQRSLVGREGQAVGIAKRAADDASAAVGIETQDKAAGSFHLPESET